MSYEISSDYRLSTLPEDRRPLCILGLGLIGGSLMRDAQAAGWPVFGWNRSEKTVTRARRDGYDVSADLEATLRRAEETDALLILGVPMPALSFLLDAISQHAPTCGFTDVTSVKQEVHDLVEAKGMSDRFVGGHPMAGTANSGWQATMHGLFRGAVWVVTYDNARELAGAGAEAGAAASTGSSAAGGGATSGAAGAAPGADADEVSKRWLDTWVRVVGLAEEVGASVIPAIARRHDSAVGRVSHLPHILAESLAVAGDSGGPLALSLAASSFRDGTRVAGTDPDLVRAMVENNRPAVLEALDQTIELLQGAREDIAHPDRSLKTLAEDGHAARGRFEARAGRNKGDASNRPIIRVRPGAPGWLDQLRSAESMGAQIGIF
ncbi:prephenate dehydrogenase [Corynebacterium jeikeium]|uniref:TyrA protein n=1 Tax=Corynebacterium jeikeium (strain K411) TaxID=306537 RepID=Q4JSK0_CORJK|nr:prephenate dehydrogenase [Corynebacterium jeikeium]CAI38207.1 tyrA [Corynebacterium jeikeium K411]SUY84442.1 prephenate dehydrogenase [Corynebacterium jeikeium]